MRTGVGGVGGGGVVGGGGGVDYREHGEVNTALLPLTPSPLLPETFPRSPSNLQTRPGPRQRGRAARTVGVKQGFRWGPLLFHRPWLNVGSAGPTLTYGLSQSLVSCVEHRGVSMFRQYPCLTRISIPFPTPEPATHTHLHPPPPPQSHPGPLPTVPNPPSPSVYPLPALWLGLVTRRQEL